MVQSGSAQREPSMEEILASIRRIIEDSDTARPPEDDAPAGMAVAGDAEQGEVEAFRAELDAPSPAKPAPSMADIQATISGATTPVAPRQTHTAEIAPFRDDIAPAAVEVDEGIDAPAAFEPTVEAEEEFDSPEAIAVEEKVAQPAFFRPAPAETLAPRSSIISEQAGRQVAAAFEELSEAFAATRKRSFDDMAEEMLRPMLQDWLDNNLPTLVERLVREEIERVARGGQG